MKQKAFICECRYPSHQLVVEIDPDDDIWNVSFHLHLKRTSFWKRMRIAFKYIFSPLKAHSDFDEIIFSKEKKEEFIKFLKDGNI